MTAYFDEVLARLHRVPLGDAGASEALAVIERDVVRDVSVCSLLPDFPAQMLARLHQTVAAWSFATREDELPPVDLESVGAAAERLAMLVDGLHTVFHEVARLDVPGFTDDPTSPVRALANRASGARLAVWRMFGGADKALCPRCGTPVSVVAARWTVGIVTGNPYDSVTVEVPGWGYQCPGARCVAGASLVLGFSEQARALRHEALVTLLMTPGAPASCVMPAREDYLALDLEHAAARLGTTPEALRAVEAGPERAPMGEYLREALLDAMTQVRV